MLNTLAPCGTWPDGWSIHRVSLPLPVPRAWGDWFLQARLFAEGADFTSPRAGTPGYQGVSTLRSLWEGPGQPWTREAMGLEAWVLALDGEAQGVVAWVRTQPPQAPFRVHEVPELLVHPLHRPARALSVAPLGGVMVYLQASHRGQGLVRRTLVEHVGPVVLDTARAARAAGHLPYVSALDAAARLWADASPVPVVPRFDLGLPAQRALWACAGPGGRHAEFRVEAHPLPAIPVPVAPPRRGIWRAAWAALQPGR